LAGGGIMPFHKFNITAESKSEMRSYSTSRSKEGILAEIEEELLNDNYYEVKYHLCNHDIPVPCEDETVVSSKGEIPEKPIELL
jgi:hypothetical protein